MSAVAMLSKEEMIYYIKVQETSLENTIICGAIIVAYYISTKIFEDAFQLQPECSGQVHLKRPLGEHLPAKL